MPYKDPQKQKEAKARWWREFRTAHPEYHRDQMRQWRLKFGPAIRLGIFASPEQELAYLIKQQKKDASCTQIKRGILSYDTVFVPRRAGEHAPWTVYDSEFSIAGRML